MGRNFIFEFRRIYGQGVARYVVPFFSAEYLAGAYPRDEYNAAVTWSIALRDDAYILPIVVGDVTVPEELLSSLIGYLRAEDYTVEQLALATADRIRGSASTVSRQGGPVVAVALTFHSLVSITRKAFADHGVCKDSILAATVVATRLLEHGLNER